MKAMPTLTDQHGSSSSVSQQSSPKQQGSRLCIPQPSSAQPHLQSPQPQSHPDLPGVECGQAV